MQESMKDIVGVLPTHRSSQINGWMESTTVCSNVVTRVPFIIVMSSLTCGEKRLYVTPSYSKSLKRAVLIIFILGYLKIHHQINRLEWFYFWFYQFFGSIHMGNIIVVYGMQTILGRHFLLKKGRRIIVLEVYYKNLIFGSCYEKRGSQARESHA